MGSLGSCTSVISSFDQISTTVSKSSPSWLFCCDETFHSIKESDAWTNFQGLAKQVYSSVPSPVPSCFPPSSVLILEGGYIPNPTNTPWSSQISALGGVSTLNNSLNLANWPNLRFLLWKDHASLNFQGHSNSKLRGLALPGNQLEGEFPEAIFSIPLLKYLDLADNHLEGTLPLDLGYQLPKLEYLSLVGNNFLGPLPLSLKSLLHLKHLNVSRNQLVQLFRTPASSDGTTPPPPEGHGVRFSGQLRTFNASNNNFRDTLFLTQHFEISNLEEFDIHANPNWTVDVGPGKYPRLTIFHAEHVQWIRIHSMALLPSNHSIHCSISPTSACVHGDNPPGSVPKDWQTLASNCGISRTCSEAENNLFPSNPNAPDVSSVTWGRVPTLVWIFYGFSILGTLLLCVFCFFYMYRRRSNHQGPSPADLSKKRSPLGDVTWKKEPIEELGVSGWATRAPSQSQGLDLNDSFCSGETASVMDHSVDGILNRSVSTSQKRLASVKQNEDAPTQHMVAKVIHPHIPDRGDEIALVIHDIVLIETVFDDGWAAGTNISRSVQGVFPLSCVHSVLEPDSLHTPCDASDSESLLDTQMMPSSLLHKKNRNSDLGSSVPVEPINFEPSSIPTILTRELISPPSSEEIQYAPPPQLFQSLMNSSNILEPMDPSFHSSLSSNLPRPRHAQLASESFLPPILTGSALATQYPNQTVMLKPFPPVPSKLIVPSMVQFGSAFKDMVYPSTQVHKSKDEKWKSSPLASPDPYPTPVSNSPVDPEKSPVSTITALVEDNSLSSFDTTFPCSLKRRHDGTIS